MTDPTLSDILEENQKLFKRVQELTAENMALKKVLSEIMTGKNCSSGECSCHDFAGKVLRKTMEKVGKK